MTPEYTIHVGPRSMEWLPVAESSPNRATAIKICRAYLAQIAERFDVPVKGEIRQGMRLMNSFGIFGKSVREVYAYAPTPIESYRNIKALARTIDAPYRGQVPARAEPNDPLPDPFGELLAAEAERFEEERDTPRQYTRIPTPIGRSGRTGVHWDEATHSLVNEDA